MKNVDPAAPNVRVVGRYALYGAIAAGGMATVHLGRLMGPVGFSRTVAIKRLHAQFASDPEFVSMFLDEARLAARIRHPNVVPTLDVVATSGELFLVMDYVPGESLSRLARAAREKRTSMPLRVLSSVLSQVLHGLHAAHEARDERGAPLGIVHRDVSPQNVLVGSDGVARVLDFGVAKAQNRMQSTKEGQIKGKLSYMPPEQLRGGEVTRATDIYAAGVMLWELLTGQRLFTGDNEGAIVTKILEGRVTRPSMTIAKSNGATLTQDAMRALESLDETTMRALRMNPDQRFTTAREMAIELERRCPPATASEVSDWVEHIARDVLDSRAALVAEIESSASMTPQELRDNGVMKVLNSPALGATGMGTSATGPTGPTAPTLGSASGSDVANMARTQALPGASMPSQPPAMQTGPNSWVPVAPSSAPSAMTSRPSGSYLPPYVDGPPVTQPSSISVSQSAVPGSDSSTKPVLAALAGVTVGLVLLGGALYLKQKPPAGPTASTGVVTTAPTGAGPQAPPGTGAESPPTTPVATVIPGPMPTTAAGTPTAMTPTPIVPGPVTPVAPTTAKPRIVKPSASPASAPKPAADDCNPDFTIGADGVKRFKPQCLK